MIISHPEQPELPIFAMSSLRCGHVLKGKHVALPSESEMASCRISEQNLCQVFHRKCLVKGQGRMYPVHTCTTMV